MSRSEPLNIIVGSDGLIGGALMASLARSGESVLGTTRRPERVDHCHPYLDLSQDVGEWLPGRPVGVAIICAGITKIESCRRDSATSARVNVDGVLSVIKNVADRGAFVVYLSTNAVFDGSAPSRLADDALSPTTEYGRQKAAVEKRLREMGTPFSIVRFTKVLEPGMGLLKEWSQCLKNGEAIHPFHDMVVAPVPLSLAVSVLQIVSRTRSAGIIQVSAEKDVTYAEVAYYVARRLGASPELVRPISASSMGIPSEAVFANTTLDISRLQREFRMAPPDVWDVIDSAIGET